MDSAFRDELASDWESLLPDVLQVTHPVPDEDFEPCDKNGSDDSSHLSPIADGCAKVLVLDDIVLPLLDGCWGQNTRSVLSGYCQPNRSVLSASSPSLCSAVVAPGDVFSFPSREVGVPRFVYDPGGTGCDYHRCFSGMSPRRTCPQSRAMETAVVADLPVEPVVPTLWPQKLMVLAIRLVVAL